MSARLVCPTCTAVAPLLGECALTRCPRRFIPEPAARTLWAIEKERPASGRVLQIAGSPNWYLSYNAGGRRVFESSRTSDRDAAERLLEERLGSAGAAVS